MKMETEQIQQSRSIDPRWRAEAYESDDELACANCGYYASDRDEYEYHVRLCSIPA